MFLKQTLKRNKELIRVAKEYHISGLIEPDTYVIDLDTTLNNAQKILEKAKSKNIELYFMTKQFGRNPLMARELMNLGYRSSVVVDFREAEIMMENKIPIGNLGHLVQPPKFCLEKIMKYGCEVITVYSLEKIKEIDVIAKKLDIKQDILLKVFDDEDLVYPGQEGGFHVLSLEKIIDEVMLLKNVRIVGATSFPAFLFNSNTFKVESTNNHETIYSAIKILRNRGVEVQQINLPSTTSVLTLENIDEINEKCIFMEPGHGLTGTTPSHAIMDLEEIPSVVYVSEISHTFKDKSYAYGGGYYRRSHLENAVVFNNDSEIITRVNTPAPTNIDYTFELEGIHPVCSTVIMAFRFQIFTSRSKVAVVKGIQSNNPVIVGIFDSQGRKL
ncbi:MULTISPECIES: alanine racemase [Terrabacteria group]|uniref:alanine racemase n=1 Tax=Bacillati TaxID=1783272 RepID=UPI001C6ECF66|nr:MULTISPECIES: alanine racemase [Terrabacteria group]MBW9212988.1 alanine racemase [Trueperella sp. zg.1013]